MNLFFFLGREVLDEAAAAIGVGVTTDEVDRIVHEASVDRECYPSPLNYYQFPKRYDYLYIASIELYLFNDYSIR